MVVNPKSIDALRNLVLSVDYWNIEVADAIIAPGRNLILNQCYAEGNPYFCQFVTRFPQQFGASSPGALKFITRLPSTLRPSRRKASTPCCHIARASIA